MLRVLLALAIALTVFAVAWLTQDWINAILNQLPLTKGPAGLTETLFTFAALPFILLFNILVAPGALVVAVLEPFCGCGSAVAGPVLIASAMLCGLTSGGLWLYHRHS